MPKRTTLLPFLMGVALVLLPACREDGGKSFAQAEKQYQALLEQGKPAHDPGFTEVLTQLEKVPRDSRFSVKARRLEVAIAQARHRRPPIPLATGGHGGADGGIEALKDACEEMARQMGVSQYESERKDLEARVIECRSRVEKIREEAHHEATPGDDHTDVH